MEDTSKRTRIGTLTLGGIVVPIHDASANGRHRFEISMLGVHPRFPATVIGIQEATNCLVEKIGPVSEQGTPLLFYTVGIEAEKAQRIIAADVEKLQQRGYIFTFYTP
ncbi:hypothetical protein J4460_03060 [Candidatus Woesearchaeota archaeon]|nr:MAG: hypothetical protein QS99_C0006G0033 [archaeon GW2011_AR4]MBS3129626.1 hypothetical protein [Candidatus Woesearchaeota archaeon]HIH37665.1 hypothetical protein [Candidatus Woesearchaeota archaeon]HIH48826.1 hypothetical protein [Candidatus Woesearchaeota archaeon]HIJ02936.1 hypothetical protein [Candidatus Woesearchaeota archaeon]